MIGNLKLNIKITGIPDEIEMQSICEDVRAAMGIGNVTPLAAELICEEVKRRIMRLVAIEISSVKAGD